MTKAVIFDLDGTLADTLPDIMTAVNGVRAHYGLPSFDEKYVLKFINGDTAEFARNIEPDLPDDKIDEAIGIYKAHYSKCYLEKTHEYDGMTELLKTLRSHGIKLAVFSNKADEYVKNLAKKLFPGIFDYALGAGIYASKPSPDGANAILETFGVSSHDAVFVGDSDVDINTAKNAGIRAVGVSWGYRGHEFLEKLGGCEVVDTMAELEEKILKNN